MIPELGTPLLAWLVTFVLCCLLVALVIVFNHVLSRHQRQQEESIRAGLERIAKASEPRPFSLPAKKGFDRNRRAS